MHICNIDIHRHVVRETIIANHENMNSNIMILMRTISVQNSNAMQRLKRNIILIPMYNIFNQCVNMWRYEVHITLPAYIYSSVLGVVFV